jgi:hypothetical protein
MRPLADIHISPRTVKDLISFGNDVVRVSEILPLTATGKEIVTKPPKTAVPS